MPFLVGDPGTGKSTLGEILSKLFGEAHSIPFTRPEELTAKFDQMGEHSLFGFGDECQWRHGTKDTNFLKSLVTKDRIQSEKKGVDASTRKNNISLMATTNDMHAINLEFLDRRWPIFHASKSWISPPTSDEPLHVENRKYWDKLNQWLVGGGYGHVLHYLLNLDLGTFTPRKFHETDARARNKIASLHGMPKWMLNAISSGELRIRKDVQGDRYCPTCFVKQLTEPKSEKAKQAYGFVLRSDLYAHLQEHWPEVRAARNDPVPTMHEMAQWLKATELVDADYRGRNGGKAETWYRLRSGKVAMERLLKYISTNPNGMLNGVPEGWCPLDHSKDGDGNVHVDPADNTPF